MSERLDEKNKAVFDTADAVRFYVRASELQPAERTIFEIHRAQLADAALLDLGVGGGRTTVHLGSNVRRYVGVDYSPKMVAAAERRFPNLKFVEADARKLPFTNAEFDAVLFSYNGIDYVDELGREAILREVWRLLPTDGLFIFSTHNLLRSDFSLGRDEPSMNIWQKLHRWRLRRMNPGWQHWSQREATIINDGAFRFGIKTYYVRPSAQLKAL